MLTKHRVGIDAIFIVAILVSGASSTFSSIYGSTNVTAGIAEQPAMENNFNHDIDSASSSPTISSQSSPYIGQDVRDIKSLFRQ